MPNKKSVFNAKAINLEKVFLLSGEDTSFRIPEYQRSYDWKKNNIQRLIEDILAGLSWHSYYSNSLTFLGTIITSEDQEKEEHFEGNSLVIIDGQPHLSKNAEEGT